MTESCMTRRTFTKVAVAAVGATMTLSLTGCGGGGAAIYTAGTYEAAYEGKDGDVPVTVEFSESKIVSVTVGENEETEGIGTVAIENIPPAIVEAQSAEVDVISGATLTSQAIIDGVMDCIAQASL